MKADAWMPFYIADYLRKTMRLTRDQHGGYLLLIMACWDGGGRLANDPAQLAAIAKASPSEWRKLAPVLLPYFEIDGDWLIQDRVLTEHAKAAQLSETRRATGALGGRPRKQDETKPPSKEKPIGFCADNQNGSQTETPALVARPSPSPFPSESSGGGAQARDPSDDWPKGDPLALIVAEIGSPWLDPSKSPGLITTSGRLAAWRRDGASWEHDVLPVVRGLCSAQRSAVSTWKFFDSALERAVAENRRAMETPEAGRVIVPLRGRNIGEEIAAEKDEAHRRTIAMLEAGRG